MECRNIARLAAADAVAISSHLLIHTLRRIADIVVNRVIAGKCSAFREPCGNQQPGRVEDEGDGSFVLVLLSNERTNSCASVARIATRNLEDSGPPYPLPFRLIKFCRDVLQSTDCSPASATVASTSL
jgi:hypothetical protein